MTDQRIRVLLDGHTNRGDEATNDLIEGFSKRGVAKVAHKMALL